MDVNSFKTSIANKKLNTSCSLVVMYILKGIICENASVFPLFPVCLEIFQLCVLDENAQIHIVFI